MDHLGVKLCTLTPLTGTVRAGWNTGIQSMRMTDVPKPTLFSASSLQTNGFVFLEQRLLVKAIKVGGGRAHRNVEGSGGKQKEIIPLGIRGIQSPAAGASSGCLYRSSFRRTRSQ